MVVKQVNDLINDFLEVNVWNLCQVNVMIWFQIECGVFDIEIVCIVNVELIVIIEDSLCIVDEGKICCVVVEIELQMMEVELCKVLVLVSVKQFFGQIQVWL